MKVGTDGILLGAWADCTAVSQALDIGTGTGLLALMLAQRNASAQIDAVEIDAIASEQARDNVARSFWSDRICVINASIQEYTLSQSASYDLIICNPPFFDAQTGTLAPDGARQAARHTTKLTYVTLLKAVQRLLAANGRFCLILPYQSGISFQERARDYGFHCSKMLCVKSVARKPHHRLLLQFEKEKKPLQRDELIIEGDRRHQYTEAFVGLTKAFYLNF